MRDYGKVSPQFWTGGTGKALRRDPDAQRVAFYLMTAPHANMIGVYHLPAVYVANDVGMTLEGASKALARLSEAGFCTYSEASEWVFVHNFAEHQVGETLRPGDNRLVGIVRELQKVADPALQLAFWSRYRDPFGLPNLPDGKPLASPLQAPLKPEAVAVAVTEERQCASAEADARVPVEKRDPVPYAAIVDAYHEALPMLPAVRKLTDARRKKLRSRWMEDAERQTVDYWREFFGFAAQSDFLTGRNGRWTGCDFEWLIESSNHLRVVEGKYESRGAA